MNEAPPEIVSREATATAWRGCMAGGGIGKSSVFLLKSRPVPGCLAGISPRSRAVFARSPEHDGKLLRRGGVRTCRTFRSRESPRTKRGALRRDSRKRRRRTEHPAPHATWALHDDPCGIDAIRTGRSRRPANRRRQAIGAVVRMSRPGPRGATPRSCRPAGKPPRIPRPGCSATFAGMPRVCSAGFGRARR